MFIYKPNMPTYQGCLQMTLLPNKKNKLINVNSRASKNAQIKPRQHIKKKKQKIKYHLKSCWT